MLHIAVCDDDPADLREVQGHLEAYLQARPALSGQVHPFSSGSALLEAAGARGGFDVYLLDVVMPEPDGIQTGLRLRERGEDGEILYLTSSRDYAVESYDARALAYLLKPVAQEKLFAALDRAAAKWDRGRTESVLVRTPHGPRRILLEQILYVERVGHVMRYCCTGEVVESSTLRGSFQEAAAPLLADPRFFLCGASLVFHLRHVRGVEASAALLDTGVRVPIPRRWSAAFKSAWGKFWLEGV